jgi:hypothetical protein
MILQALKEYYDRRASDPESGIAPPGWERKEIPFVLVLDRAGNLIQIEDTRQGVAFQSSSSSGTGFSSKRTIWPGSFTFMIPKRVA